MEKAVDDVYFGESKMNDCVHEAEGSSTEFG